MCLFGVETQSTKSQSQILFNELVVEKEIGEGSYGKVFLGKWNDAPVALKFCRNNVKIEEFIFEVKVMMYVCVNLCFYEFVNFN
jgi:predicted Ser/Thr protein kinase